MIVTDKQKELLKPYIPNVESFVKTDDTQGLLDEINDLIIDDILGNEDEPTAVGIALQKVWDDIFYQN
jgi:hypothetical protein